MKQLTEYNRVSGYLNKIFDKLNARFFENTLSKPIITIQSTPRAYGHVTVGKVWKSEGVERKELNIGAGTLSRPIENIVATMLHEMVHLYCADNGIKDTSRGYTYHNKNFKEQAEKRALHIEHDPRIGYSITTPTDELVEWCIDEDLTEILINRTDGISLAPRPTGNGGASDTGTTAPTRRPSSTRKYVCPHCGQSIRATKTVNLICGTCYDESGNIYRYEIAE